MTHNENGSPLVRIVGGLGMVMVAAGIVVATAQALRSDDGRASGDVPAITLVVPQSGDTVDAPIPVRFRAGNRLALGPMGWASDDLHLHAYIDGMEIMPAAADIEPAGDGSFIWHLPALPGERTLELSWAGMQHGAMSEGASEAIRIVVR